MARLSSANAPDITTINLTRLLARLQQTLVNPDSATESRLRTSLEREKVGTNIEYARTLLVKLEQDAHGIKVQSKKHEVQTDLVQKREMIQRLSERLEELNELGDFESREDDSSEGEDLLGEDTPSEETDSHAGIADPESTSSSPIGPTPPPFVPPPQARPPPPTVESEPEPPSTLRARNKDAQARAELLTPASTSTGISTATTEAMLTHNRTEQENLTGSLLAMASALKESSRAFATSLEEEKSVLESATSGLDKNELGLEAAQRRIGYLRTMTEGRGWLGRMLMYAWIAGLMVLAILIVFVMPKLRF
ncbi:synaptobrevin [Rhexocercosporidium sp. MPI-PUGE-AT-0058]|nr:synaptobrevin [Rhexocercosporidium sp. MPI-PUGE-AT-0058]